MLFITVTQSLLINQTLLLQGSVNKMLLDGGYIKNPVDVSLGLESTLNFKGSTAADTAIALSNQPLVISGMKTIAEADVAIKVNTDALTNIRGPLNISGNDNLGNDSLLICLTLTRPVDLQVLRFVLQFFNKFMSIGIGTAESVSNVNGSLCIRINGSTSSGYGYYGNVIDLSSTKYIIKCE